MNETRAVDCFYDYLLGILKIYADLAPVLMDEVERIKNDDMPGLDESLRLQQAMLLKTRDFEAKVAGYQKELGISAANLSTAVVQLPEDERFRFYSLLGEFDQIMEQVRFYRDSCRELLQTKLYQMEKQAQDSGLAQGATYDEFAESVSGSYAKVFETRI
ncbi:MAG: hypothetical protein LBG71_00505 [Clostridiales Family XIII bacterium]|jgi:hypothetical protein|nr:hypothetical protein [Clostridiales Family XIII bacterium]